LSFRNLYGFSKGKLDEDCIYQLKPSLYPFIKDREVKITFDADAMTKESVFNAVKILYKLIETVTGTVSIVEWFNHYLELAERVKGMDDLIAYLGIEVFRERLEKSITLPEYQRLITDYHNQTLVNLLIEYKNTEDFLIRLNIKKQIIDLRDDLKYPSNFDEALNYYSNKLLEKENNSNDSLITNPLDFWEETKMIEWIVPNYFTRQSVSIIYGESGLGKSLLTYNLSKALIEATSFMDIPISKKHKVLYIQCDESPQETKQRMDTIGLKEHFFNKDFMLIPQNKGWNFEQIRKLDEEISSLPTENKPDFLIIDNLNHAKGALLDINSSEIESMVIIPLKKLATKYNLHVLILHHPRKNNDSFLGSSTIKNSLSYMGILKRSFNGLILEDDKCRNSSKRLVQFDFNESMQVIDAKSVNPSEIEKDNSEDKKDPLIEFLLSVQQTLIHNHELINTGFTQKDINEYLELNKMKVSRFFKQAVDEGYFKFKETQGKNKLYGLTDKFKDLTERQIYGVLYRLEIKDGIIKVSRGLWTFDNE
jgi:archaellum biogenesis ATPase FlaH